VKKVLIYTTETCPYCIKAKEYLGSHNIEFEVVDVSADRDRVQEMIDKSGQMGVPVLDIDGEIIIGFDKVEIDKKLGIK